MTDKSRQRVENECAKFKKLMSAYIDDETGSPECESVSIHVAECSSCKRELTNLYAMRDMIKNVYAPKENVDFSSSIMVRINPPGVKGKCRCQPKKSGLGIRIVKYGAVAAVVFAALGGTLLYSGTQTKKIMAEKRKFDTYVVEHATQTADYANASSQVIAVNFEK